MTKTDNLGEKLVRDSQRDIRVRIMPIEEVITRRMWLLAITLIMEPVLNSCK